MASFKICVVLAIAASVVSGQESTISKGQESNQGVYVQVPSFAQSKQVGDAQNQQGDFPTSTGFSGFGQNLQQSFTQSKQAGGRQNQQGDFPSSTGFSGFGQNLQQTFTQSKQAGGRQNQQGDFPSSTGFSGFGQNLQQSLTQSKQTGGRQNQQEGFPFIPSSPVPSFDQTQEGQIQNGGFPFFPNFQFPQFPSGQNQEVQTPDSAGGANSPFQLPQFPSFNLPFFNQNQEQGDVNQQNFQFPGFDFNQIINNFGQGQQPAALPAEQNDFQYGKLQ